MYSKLNLTILIKPPPHEVINTSKIKIMENQRRKKIISYEITKLGKYLKQLREELDLSIRSVAIKCKLAPSYLSKIEAGDTFKTIGVSTLVGLSKFYNIPVAHLLKESGFTENDDDELPGLSAYLRKKYQLSPQAIRDMEMAKEIVDKKYTK